MLFGSKPKAPEPLPAPTPQIPIESAKLETGVRTKEKSLTEKTTKKRLQIPSATQKIGGVGLGRIL